MLGYVRLDWIVGLLLHLRAMWVGAPPVIASLGAKAPF